MPLVFNLKLRETSNSREFKGLSTHSNPEGFRLMWPHFFQPWQDRSERQECQEHADLSLHQLIYQWFIIVSTVQRSASLIATAATGSRALPNQRWDAGTRSWKHCIIRLRNAFIRKLCTTWNKCEPAWTEKDQLRQRLRQRCEGPQFAWLSQTVMMDHDGMLVQMQWRKTTFSKVQNNVEEKAILAASFQLHQRPPVQKRQEKSQRFLCA